MEQKPILDIATFTERRVIRIDGKPYEIYERAELPVLTNQKIRLLWQKLTTIEQIKKPKKVHEAEYLKVLREMVAIAVVGIPRSVVAKLLRQHMVSIVLAFFRLPLVVPVTPAATAKPKTARKAAKK